MVLIVEDDTDTADALAEVLIDAGHQVAVAPNGRAAIELLRSRAPPCVILLDLMMPVMNGHEFRVEQVRDARLADIPTVVMSAHPDAARMAGELRAHGLLTKPLERQAVLDEVARHC